MFGTTKVAAACALLGVGSVQAIFLNVKNDQSVRDVAAQIAGDAVKNFYLNAPIQAVGELARPYYWWEAGAFWGSMVAYSAYTGDPSLNDVTGYAILSQVAPTKDFMVLSHKADLGNDDQVIWALTAMEAAEHGFPVPAANKSSFGNDIWITAAKGAYETMAQRWDTSTCNGGLRWQIFSQNSGYTYKSAIANAGFFQLAARLARFTGDSDGKYAKSAKMVYDWMSNTGIIVDHNDDGKMVFDGATTTSNCQTVDMHRWTYNAASMYLGAEMLADMSKDSAATWGPVATGLLKGIQNTFLNNEQYPGVFFELMCEAYGSCNNDQLAFKALAMRWLNKIRAVSPASYNNAILQHYTENSANAAAGQCAGGSTKTLCGTKWIGFGWDGTSGPGQQISSLEAVQGLLAPKAKLATASSSAKRDVEPEFAARGLTARDYMEMSDAARLRL